MSARRLRSVLREMRQMQGSRDGAQALPGSDLTRVLVDVPEGTIRRWRRRGWLNGNCLTVDGYRSA